MAHPQFSGLIEFCLAYELETPSNERPYIFPSVDAFSVFTYLYIVWFFRADLLKQSQKEDVSRVWFQGEEPYFDIFLELKNDKVAWFQFTLRGRSLSWDSKTPGWQTGTTNDLKIDDVSFYAAIKTIENDTKLDSELINLVKSILQTRAEETIFAKALTLFN